MLDPNALTEPPVRVNWQMYTAINPEHLGLEDIHLTNYEAVQLQLMQAESWRNASTEAIHLLREALSNMEHELALLMNRHWRPIPCCDFSRKTRGWNHDSSCKNFVVCH